MGTELKKITDADLDILLRQCVVFGIMRNLFAFGLFAYILFHTVNAISIALVAFFGYRLVKYVRWPGTVREGVTNARPVLMNVYFSRSSWSPFSSLQATLYDARRYDPFGTMFKPKWKLFGTNWDSGKVVGDARECLVYVNRDNGQVLAFALSEGVLFPRPGRKLDVSELVRTGEAKNVEESYG